MATAKMTLIGYNNWFESFNQDLFEYLTVPTGIDRSLLINNILLKGGEFEVLYGDPNFTKNMIGVWSSKWQHTMERWINALSIEYNPLENYDRMEDWTDNGQKMTSNNVKENNNRVSTTGVKENAFGNDYSVSEGSGNTENTRSAYNSSVYQPHDNIESSSDGKNTSSSLTSANSTTNNLDSISNESKGTGSEINGSIHSGRMHGNIGVTTSQQMLEAELDVAKWNIYDEIADLFISEFCIYLY